MFPLTVTHLRFVCEALMPIRSCVVRRAAAIGSGSTHSARSSASPSSTQSAIRVGRLGARNEMPGAGRRLCLIPLRCASGTVVSGGPCR